MRIAPAAGPRLTNDLWRPCVWRCAKTACLLLALGMAMASPARSGAAELAGTTTPERQIDFGRDIQPILARRCFACHGPDKAEGGLRLDRNERALAELDSGAHAVVPGKPDDS